MCCAHHPTHDFCTCWVMCKTPKLVPQPQAQFAHNPHNLCTIDKTQIQSCCYRIRLAFYGYKTYEIRLTYTCSKCIQKNGDKINQLNTSVKKNIIREPPSNVSTIHCACAVVFIRRRRLHCLLYYTPVCRKQGSQSHVVTCIKECTMQSLVKWKLKKTMQSDVFFSFLYYPLVEMESTKLTYT